MKPDMTDAKTIARNVLMPSRLVAGERVRMAHVVGSVVDDVDMGEADHADDEHAEHHGHHGLRQPSHLPGGDRQRDLALGVGELGGRELRRAHGLFSIGDLSVF